MSLQKNYIFLVLLFVTFLFNSCSSSVDQPTDDSGVNVTLIDQNKAVENNLAYSNFREKLLDINTDSIYEYWSHYPPRMRQNFEFIIIEWNMDNQTHMIKLDAKGYSQYGNNMGSILTDSEKSKISKTEIKRFISESGRFRESARPIDHRKIVAPNTIQFFLYDGISANVERYSIENIKQLHSDRIQLYKFTLELQKKFTEI